LQGKGLPLSVRLARPFEVRSDRGANPSSVRNGWRAVDGEGASGGGRRAERCDGARRGRRWRRVAALCVRPGRSAAEVPVGARGWIALILSAIAERARQMRRPTLCFRQRREERLARKRLNRDSRSPKITLAHFSRWRNAGHSAYPHRAVGSGRSARPLRASRGVWTPSVPRARSCYRCDVAGTLRCGRPPSPPRSR